MDDVKSPSPEQTGQVETTTAPSENKQEVTTVADTGTDTAVAAVSPETENLKKALKEARTKLTEHQRELAQFKAKEESAKYSQGDPDYYGRLLADPYVQDLILKDAKRDLTDFARETLEDPKYSSLHPQVKKAVISNARGFVKESTTDVETAKIDLLEWVENLLEESQEQTPPETKGFQIASTNAPSTEPKGRPGEIARIVEKSPMEITDDEAQVLEQYIQSQGKKSKT